MPGDYDRIARLFNSVYFEVKTADDLEREDRRIPTSANLKTNENGFITGFCRERAVAVDDSGYVLGFAQAWLAPWSAPGRLSSHVIVDSRYYSNGIGKALYLHLEGWARSMRASSIQTELKDHLPYALPFAERLGFNVRSHNRYSSLSTASFRMEPYSDIIPLLQRRGFQFCTWKEELAKAGANLERLYNLYKNTYIDIPGKTVPEYTLAQWAEALSQTDPELVLTVSYRDEYVGLSQLEFKPKGNFVWHEYTGVERNFRGIQMAHALKLWSIKKAIELGADRLITSNDIGNTPMITLNEKLGYRRVPGHYVIEKSFV